MVEINNTFYQELGDAWWTANDHMIAFLRAETAIRLDYIVSQLPASEKPLKILDLGAGGGLITVPLAQRGHHITAVDLSDASLDVLLRKARSEGVDSRVSVIQADILEPLSLAEKFDVVLAMDVLEHIPTPELVVAHSRQYLTLGGKFIYHTINQTWQCWLIYLQLAPRIIRHSPKHVHIYRYCIKPVRMSEWLQQAGFKNHTQRGIRPVLTPALIGELLLQRRLDMDLQFDYCKSLALGYLGCAQLDAKS
jgi:2-polyprenyl-6-hydroxyphenyl methylase/3-demethylubiquinone-9 3-methyltransferase